MKEKIYLREIEKKDSELIAEWFNDRDNVKLMSTTVRSCRHTAESVWKEYRDMKKFDPDYEKLFMICLEGEKNPIGHAGIDEIDLNDRRGEIFFLIGEKNLKGKGYGKRTAELLIEYAFEKMKLNSLFATVCVENHPAMRVIEGTGFKTIGVRRQYNYMGEGFVDEKFYDLLAEEYYSHNKKSL